MTKSEALGTVTCEEDVRFCGPEELEVAALEAGFVKCVNDDFLPNVMIAILRLQMPTFAKMISINGSSMTWLKTAVAKVMDMCDAATG